MADRIARRNEERLSRDAAEHDRELQRDRPVVQGNKRNGRANVDRRRGLRRKPERRRARQKQSGDPS